MNNTPTPIPETDHGRTGVSVADLKAAYLDNLYYAQAKFPAVATRNDRYMALAVTVRDRLLLRWVRSAETYYRKESRTVCYLSAEYLLGPHLGNNLLNLGITEPVRQAMAELGLDLDELIAQEEEPGLGNGGLGRLAACFLDSMATLQIPSFGYGIRYEFGIFDQEIRDGEQVERTDKWLRYGNPWEVARPEIALPVGFGGATRSYRDANGRYRVEWAPDHVVLGTAYDTPILGHRVGTANTLRLWHAQAVESFDFQAFNAGDYYGAVSQKIASENISKVLYPNDELLQGKTLRLQQQYFFVSCALQDMLRLYRQKSPGDLSRFAEKFAVQLNDTHPAVAVAELMRLLVDVHQVDWDAAWDTTTRTFAYTNHTLLPEALETWGLEQFGKLLPRHLEIILEINHRFLERVKAKYPGDTARLRRMSLIDERDGRAVRMAHLACVGSHSVNGVSELHSRLLRDVVLRDFNEFEPGKFRNVTNGVTPRRFVALSNPPLAALLTEALGDGWLTDLDRLIQLEQLIDDPAFRAAWQAVKRTAKERFAAIIKARTGVVIDPSTLFDVQAKRFHEYKRQHLNVLHVIAWYLKLKDGSAGNVVPRTVLFAGKAAPGYFLAKLIIKLIHGVAAVVNADPAVAGRLRVAFLPDFNVTNAQPLYPAADLSEQISTAGKEASGTGNMKFALNGALTIGTLDGANIEIREAVGADNFFVFGLTAEQVAARLAGGYDPAAVYRADPRLKAAIDCIADGTFSDGDPTVFRPLVDNLLKRDPYLVLADFAAYAEAQAAVARTYADPEEWVTKSILNVARMGRFSSDRSIRDYARDIWQVEPVPIV